MFTGLCPPLRIFAIAELNHTPRRSYQIPCSTLQLKMGVLEIETHSKILPRQPHPTNETPGCGFGMLQAGEG